jgi:hypothetical protein
MFLPAVWYTHRPRTAGQGAEGGATLCRTSLPPSTPSARTSFSGSRRARALLPLAAAFAVLRPAVAAAQPPPPDAAAPAPAPPPDAYKQHMENGVKLYQDKSFEAAIAEFRAAYDAHPKASPLQDVALCYKSLRNYPRAIEALEKALARHADGMTADDTKAAQDAIAEMRGLLAYVTVKLSPPSATLLVDGEPQPPGAEAQPLPLGPGTHKLAAKAEGFADVEATVSVASGEKGQVVPLKLTPVKGYVTIEAGDPKTVIAVDSTPVAYEAWKGFLFPGTHLVQMYRQGSPSAYAVEVLVVAGQAQDIRPGIGGLPVGAGRAVAPPLPPPQLPPKKEEPPKRGLFGLATAAVLFPTTSPNGFNATSTNSGGAGGFLIGYRVNTAAAFDFQFQYANMFTPGTGSNGAPGGYTWGSTRFGLDLRLMTAGRTARFVGGVGGGFSIDQVKLDSTIPCETNADLATPGSTPTTSGCTASGASPFVTGQLGLELDFGGVLLDVGLQTHVFSSRGITIPGGDGIFDNNSLFDFGGGLGVGYGAW